MVTTYSEWLFITLIGRNGLDIWMLSFIMGIHDHNISLPSWFFKSEHKQCLSLVKFEECNECSKLIITSLGLVHTHNSGVVTGWLWTVVVGCAWLMYNKSLTAASMDQSYLFDHYQPAFISQLFYNKSFVFLFRYLCVMCTSSEFCVDHSHIFTAFLPQLTINLLRYLFCVQLVCRLKILKM